ncbi:MAG TPA: DUF5011 domain-containing protein, partial [Leucothrix mucor]|nr:DUF5011 domain-containing protein [Leucothrix mucor]
MRESYMKKLILRSFLITIFMVFIVACGGGSDDTTAPVITITNGDSISVNQNSNYVDAGATATDDVDGVVTASPSGAVNTAIPGTYTITYTATDAAGNTATKVRTVTVVAITDNRPAVIGHIRNYTTGLGVAGVSVSIGSGAPVVSQANGSYLVYVNNPGARVVVNASGNGYSATSKIVSVSATAGSRTSLDIDILPVAYSNDNIDPTQNFSMSVTGTPARVEIDAGSLVKADGSLPVGRITGSLTPIDPALDISLMPGEMKDSNGELIASYGAMTIDFMDNAGNRLNLATGQTSRIRIPVSNKGGSIPQTIPLYYYDEVQGYWVAEGTATLAADQTYYEGSVGHFSTWNADYLYQFITIHGCVQNKNTTRVPNALINMEGFNYNGATSVSADANGNFSISAMKGGVSLVVASTSTKVSNTVKVGVNESTQTDVTLADCLIVGEVPLSVRLSWGLNPDDLDTHVIGPNDYHIYFVNKGSLASAPFAQLDVDDISSYGPEIFTALSF